MQEAVRAFRHLRDVTVKELKKKQAEELRPHLEKMEKLQRWMLRELQAQGAKNMATPDGTAYLVTHAKVAINDWEAAMDHVIAHQLWHMLERRLAKTAVEQYVEANEENFPGTSITYEVDVNVRAN
jgi:hypothetical protein